MNFSLVSYRKQSNTKHIDFEYHKEDKYLYAYQKNKESIFIETPPLKVFKNIHEFLNNYYLILSLENEDDTNAEIYSFKTKLDNIYGQAQHKIKKNYHEMFPNYKGIVDNLIYENCIKRPFTGSRNQLIKIILPDDNENMMTRIENLVENDIIKLRIHYKGLRKIQGGRLMEEYYLHDFILEDEWVAMLMKKNLHENPTSFEVEIVNENIRENEHMENQFHPSCQENQFQIHSDSQNHHDVCQENQQNDTHNHNIHHDIHNDNDNVDIISIQSFHENHVEENEMMTHIERNVEEQIICENHILEDNHQNQDENQNKNDIENLEVQSFENENKEKKRKNKKDKEKQKEKEKEEEERKKKLLKMKKRKEKKEKEKEKVKNDEGHLSDSEDFKSLSPEEQIKVRNIFHRMKNKS